MFYKSVFLIDSPTKHSARLRAWRLSIKVIKQKASTRHLSSGYDFSNKITKSPEDWPKNNHDYKIIDKFQRSFCSYKAER